MTPFSAMRAHSAALSLPDDEALTAGARAARGVDYPEEALRATLNATAREEVRG
jgi:hypothetical protein